MGGSSSRDLTSLEMTGQLQSTTCKANANKTKEIKETEDGWFEKGQLI